MKQLLNDLVKQLIDTEYWRIEEVDSLKGWDYRGGILVKNDFTFNFLNNGYDRIVVIGKIVSRDSRGKPTRKIVNVLVAKAESEKANWIYTYPRTDIVFIAIGHYSLVPPLEKVWMIEALESEVKVNELPIDQVLYIPDDMYPIIKFSGRMQ